MSQKKPSIPRPTASRLVAPANRMTTSNNVSASNNVTNSNANTSGLSDCSSISSIRSASSLSNRGAVHHSSSTNRLDKINHDLPRTNSIADSNEKLDLNVSNMTSSNSLGSISMARSSSLSSRTATSTTVNKTASKSAFSTTFNNDASRYAADTSANDGSSTDLIKRIEVNTEAKTPMNYFSENDLVARNRTLEEENTILRNLIHEESSTGKTTVDERRILMLKCQIYQLEKQINILSKSLAFRKDAHADAQNALNFLSDTFRNIAQTAENKSFVPPTSYTIEKGDFQRWLEFVESTRIKLNKTQTENDEEIKHLSEPTLFDSKYSKKFNENVSILDICSGNINHINLKELSSLENELTQLFKKLTRLRESFRTVQTSANGDAAHKNRTESFNGSANGSTPSQKRRSHAQAQNGTPAESKRKSELLPFHKDNLRTQLDDCLKDLNACCQNLFDMSLLVPTAPWSATKKSPIDQLTQEALLTRLKSFALPKLKYQPVEVLVKAHFIASNYHFHMKNLECVALQEELKFYRSSYSLQKSYIESVMNLFKTKYEQFTQELRLHLSEPLRALIEKFWRMKEDSTEDSLKDFLNIFKSNAKKFEAIISSMSSLAPQSDDILTVTFNQLIVQLDNEIENLNKACLNNLEKLNLDSINLNELSLQSDQLLLDIVKRTPASSPTMTPSSSMNNFN